MSKYYEEIVRDLWERRYFDKKLSTIKKMEDLIENCKDQYDQRCLDLMISAVDKLKALDEPRDLFNTENRSKLQTYISSMDNTYNSIERTKKDALLALVKDKSEFEREITIATSIMSLCSMLEMYDPARY